MQPHSSVQILSVAGFVLSQQRWVVAKLILSFIESLFPADPGNTNVGSGFAVSILSYGLSLGPYDQCREEEPL